MRRRLALVLAPLVLLAACSSDGGQTERAELRPADDAGSTAAALDGADVPGDGVPLRIAVTAPTSLDPAAASPASAPSMVLASLLHGTLTQVDADGVPRPGLADFTPDEHRRTWRFTLRDGAAFADGSPIEADDVVASLERIRAQGGASLAAIALEDVAAVVALDPRSVEVTLHAPSALLPELLASPVYGIVDRDAVPGPLDGPLNASGAHQVVEASEERLLLARRHDSGPSQVEVRIFGDEAAAAEALAAGEVDWAPVPADRLGELHAGGELAPFHAAIHLGVHAGAEPLTRPALRQAISLAVDRAAIAAAVFGPTARPAGGLVPVGVPGGRAECVGHCGPDLERARQLVAEAFPEGEPVPPLRLVTDDTAAHEAIGSLIAEQLASIGIEVVAEPVDEATFGQVVGSGQAPLFLHSSLGLARSPAVHLLPWSSTSPDNTTGYRNELVDLALPAAVDEPDLAARTARWQEIEAAVLGDVPVVPLVQLRTAAAAGPRAAGLVVRADGSVDLTGVAG